ncbi:MAG TPA: GreA/GreB family elongation factor [Clostridia bacterium]|nr:GreA/GreB family elongation factor [Clostridia bacterium]
MKIKVTETGLIKLQIELETMKQRLIDIREDKATAYSNSGDTWHDNPRFNELERAEKSAEKQIYELEEKLHNAEIVRWDENSKDKVQIGSIVLCRCEYPGEIEDIVYEIVGYGEADPMNYKISYESLVAQTLIGLSTGAKAECITPSGKVTYQVIKIYDNWDCARENLYL